MEKLIKLTDKLFDELNAIDLNEKTATAYGNLAHHINILKSSGETEIDEARRVLEDAGYYTNSLWHIEDVIGRYNCTEEEAQMVLDDVMTNECTTNNVWEVMDIIAEDYDLKLEETDTIS
mgnify:CR=1 FL=1